MSLFVTNFGYPLPLLSRLRSFEWSFICLEFLLRKIFVKFYRFIFHTFDIVSEKLPLGGSEFDRMFSSEEFHRLS